MVPTNKNSDRCFNHNTYKDSIKVIASGLNQVTHKDSNEVADSGSDQDTHKDSNQ
jgi:hypothetical protein